MGDVLATDPIASCLCQPAGAPSACWHVQSAQANSDTRSLWLFSSIGSLVICDAGTRSAKAHGE
jgi:hypothetical protein